jgi:hypothetical protein
LLDRRFYNFKIRKSQNEKTADHLTLTPKLKPSSRGEGPSGKELGMGSTHSDEAPENRRCWRRSRRTRLSDWNRKRGMNVQKRTHF